MNKNIYKYFLVLLGICLLAGFTYAAFTDKAKILGSSFSVASSDLKFQFDIPKGTNPTNLVDELTGPTFSNISQTWQQDYALKMVNNGTTKLGVTSNADYLTANDPKDLRNDIEVEIFEWNDGNADGVLDTTEVGNSFGKKTIVKWKTEGIYLGDFNPGQAKALAVRFYGAGIPSTKQGANAIFDFVFESVEVQ